jgi:hypothetical protein
LRLKLLLEVRRGATHRILIRFRQNWFEQNVTRSRLIDFAAFSIVWYSKKTQKNTTFRKLDLFPSSGERRDTLWWRLVLQNRWLPPLTWGRKHPISRKIVFFCVSQNTGRWTK